MQVNSPCGPLADSRMPGRMVACSHSDPAPPGARLAVISSRCGRVGGEAMV
jgi:hypothetical protein